MRSVSGIRSCARISTSRSCSAKAERYGTRPRRACSNMDGPVVGRERGLQYRFGHARVRVDGGDDLVPRGFEGEGDAKFGDDLRRFVAQNVRADQLGMRTGE